MFSGFQKHKHKHKKHTKTIGRNSGINWQYLTAFDSFSQSFDEDAVKSLNPDKSVTSLASDNFGMYVGGMY